MSTAHLLYSMEKPEEEEMTNSTQPQPTPPHPDYRDNAQFWVGGVFYVNRNDPRLMVEKRSGLGLTFNFAHPISWWLLAGLFVLLGLVQLPFYIMFQSPINFVITCLFFALALLVLVCYLFVRAARP